jgi:hypothetical protein
MATYVNNFTIPKNDDQNFGKAVDFSGLTDRPGQLPLDQLQPPGNPNI